MISDWYLLIVEKVAPFGFPNDYYFLK